MTTNRHARIASNQLRSVILLVLCFLLFSEAAHAAWVSGKFEVYVFDVGQADSQLIVSPTGKTILIDAGEKNWNSGSNADLIATKIRQVMGSSFNHLDYIAITHLHADHIGTAGFTGQTGYGGIWKLIERHGFTVGKLIDRNSGKWVDSNHDGVCDPNTEIEWINVGTTSGTGGKWLCYVTDPANATKFHRETAIVGSTTQINLGPSVTVKIIQSDANGVMMSDHTTLVEGDHHGESLPPSENDYSITLKLTFRNLNYITGGDTDGEYTMSSYGYRYNDVESVIAPSIGKVEVLKINHHGSSHSSNQTYINTLQPAVSLISCGANSYGHPDQAVLDRLLTNGKVFITGTCDISRNYGSSVIVNGDIVVSSADGSNYSVNGTAFVAGSIAPSSTDTISPMVTNLKVLVTPKSFATRSVKVTSFTATDPNDAVKGYKITEKLIKPSATATGWRTTPQRSYTIRSLSTRALYGWVKDAAGNVSEGRQAEVWFDQQ